MTNQERRDRRREAGRKAAADPRGEGSRRHAAGRAFAGRSRRGWTSPPGPGPRHQRESRHLLAAHARAPGRPPAGRLAAGQVVALDAALTAWEAKAR